MTVHCSDLQTDIVHCVGLQTRYLHLQRRKHSPKISRQFVMFRSSFKVLNMKSVHLGSCNKPTLNYAKSILSISQVSGWLQLDSVNRVISRWRGRGWWWPGAWWGGADTIPRSHQTPTNPLWKRRILTLTSLIYFSFYAKTCPAN